VASIGRNLDIEYQICAPGVALFAGESEHLRHRLGPVDQLALHLPQAEPALLSLQDLVRGPRLHEGHAARRDRLAVLAQGVPYRAHRRLGHRLHRTVLPALLGAIGIARPGGLDLGEVPGTVRLAMNPAGLLGAADRRLAHSDVPGEGPITGRAHPYNRRPVKF
jgi:hypothetical protein